MKDELLEIKNREIVALRIHIESLQNVIDSLSEWIEGAEEEEEDEEEEEETAVTRKKKN